MWDFVNKQKAAGSLTSAAFVPSWTVQLGTLPPSSHLGYRIWVRMESVVQAGNKPQGMQDTQAGQSCFHFWFLKCTTISTTFIREWLGQICIAQAGTGTRTHKGVNTSTICNGFDPKNKIRDLKGKHTLHSRTGCDTIVISGGDENWFLLDARSRDQISFSGFPSLNFMNAHIFTSL